MSDEVLRRSWQEAHKGGALSKLLVTLAARGCENLKLLQHMGRMAQRGWGWCWGFLTKLRCPGECQGVCAALAAGAVPLSLACPSKAEAIPSRYLAHELSWG